MPSDTFGRYKVEAEIGDGAMGRVYRGFDPLARRTVAIKTIKSELLSKQTAEEYIRRFRREAQAAGGLSHPNIVTIYDVGENYFVMELLEGETLLDMLKRCGRIDLHEALGILDPVADAIDYAHKKGIIHRDIKPANIMVLPDGRPKLMDFGVVHMESTVMTAAGQFLGSPLYMAPEQIASEEVTAKTDLFSLATVVYEMLTGRRAFEGQSITSIIYRVVNDTPLPPRRWNVELPPHYDDVFAKALAKDPAARYASASEFAGALDLKDFDDTLRSVFQPSPVASDSSPAAALETQALSSLDPPNASSTLPVEGHPVSAPSPIRRRAPMVAGAAVLALLAGAAFWMSRPGTPPAAAPAAAIPPLLIETEPAGADVFVDEESRGVTPLSLSGVALGEHVVRVSRDGFAPAQLSVSVTPEGLPPLRFVLAANVVPLRVLSQPVGSAVLLDGKEIGRTPLDDVKISSGAHEVRLELAGYQPWKTRIEAEIGKPVSLAAGLERRTPAPTAPPAPVKEGDFVESGPGVAAPRRISGKPARYPETTGKKVSGRVAVEMTVTETGEPTDLRVVESMGDAVDKAVLEAMQTWRYEPAIKDGVKVKVRIQESQSFEFRAK
jgi:TonB family protein